ncbi:hypothetical protein A8146_06570 [Mesorhizobium loti]|nr:hypothetical protein A8146_06570 [Mesorhizobium loti]
MTTAKREIESAIEVFVHGFSTGRSRIFPYEASRVGPLVRDAERNNPRDYRSEEWVVHEVRPNARMRCRSYHADS